MGLKRCESTTPCQKCGWNATFDQMQMQERNDDDVQHKTRACHDEYMRDGKVTWMNFVKVARTEETTTLDDEDYGGTTGVKFQTEWLLVEGTAKQFFDHLHRPIEEYIPHVYEIKLLNRVDRCVERAFVVDPAIKLDCPEDFKGVVSEVVDFATDIHAKQEKDLTCSFP